MMMVFSFTNLFNVSLYSICVNTRLYITLLLHIGADGVELSNGVPSFFVNILSEKLGKFDSEYKII